ncbi:MAG TPA: flavodoxin family protein [Methanocella sp.]|nr:flavodoxin family protein [Methanocella sp.]
MKVLALNGSPRKGWNTATLLNKALEGAASKGAETELIHLYDLDYKGCTSCFACKLKGGKSYGRCAYRDELTPVLEQVEDCGALLLGSPIYLSTVTGEMKSCMERLIYPYLVYDLQRSTLFPKKLPVGFVYTLGANAERLKVLPIEQHIALNEGLVARILGHCESLVAIDTYQFDDYSKYVCFHDVEGKEKQRQEAFPIDCQKAFDLGARLAMMG